jgi:hypothetical protein
MAANVRLTSLQLIDLWPGQPVVGKGIPDNGWDNTYDNFKTTDDTARAWNPGVPIGEKRTVYTDNSYCPGQYTMMYLAYHDFTSLGEISVGEVSLNTAWCSKVEQVACGSRVTFQAGDATVAPYYFVTRCTTGTSDVTSGAPVCLPCASIGADSSVELGASFDNPRAAGYGHSFGWFWVGGVCPAKDVSLFDHSAGGPGGTTPGIGADISGDDALMRAGPVVFEITSDGLMPLSTDVTNYADETGLVGNAFAHAYADMSAQ